MATKSKSFQQVKFPYEVISKAYDEFLRSLSAKNKKAIHKTWEVEHPDSKWSLDSESQFISEYVKDEILEASFICFDLAESKFSVSFSNRSYEKPNTRVSISLPDRERIERIFNVFETSYNEFLAKIKTADREDINTISQITPRYSFEKILPSTFVEKRLLIDLERYILQRGSQLDIRKKQLPDYAVTILDSSGTLSLKSIEAYPRDVFDNETEHITLSYGAAYENINIYIRFAKDKNRSKIEVSYKGENAREIVESIKLGIFQTLKDSRTWNIVYHPHFIIQILLGYGFLAAASLLIYSIYSARVWLQTSLVLSLLLLVYLIAPIFKPYTTFDTRRNSLIRKWSLWFIESVLGILLIWLVALLFPALIP